jgi:hypothetical protein
LTGSRHHFFKGKGNNYNIAVAEPGGARLVNESLQT